MLLDDLKLQISNALVRRASVKASIWSQNYVVLGKPKPGRMSFYWHPWEKEMLDCDSDWSGRKAAQMGYSHVALCRSIFTNDIPKNDVMYLLPKRSPDATDFSKAKFDVLLELSDHLSQIYSNVRNIGHKQAGNVNLFIRGARSRSGLKTISVGLQVWDELDEMPKRQLSLAIERSSGYDEEDSQLIKISTPTIPDFGIDAEIKYTDQSIFVFKCPYCGKYTDLPFPHCLKITAESLDDQNGLKNSYIFCPLCKHELPHKDKPTILSLERGAHWHPTKKGFSTRGFLINQYYSTTIPPWRIAESFLKAKLDESEEQEYWNSKGGLPHMPEGARIAKQEIANCIGSYSMHEPPPQGHLLTMGIDVGKVLHYWIDQWHLPLDLGKDINMFARPRNLVHGTVDHFEQLDQLMKDYQILSAIIDWQPEERKSFEFCQRFLGHAFRCYFRRKATGKYISRSDEDCLVGVSRVGWLDLSQARFKSKSITLPKDTLEDAKNHVNNLVKIQKKDEDDHPISRYISLGADHYAFARLYSEIALPFAISVTTHQDISNFL